MSTSSSAWTGSPQIKEICCIGAGFVGGSTGPVLASQLRDINVTVVDLNQARIDAWNSNSLPIWEPGLDELVEFARGPCPPPQPQNLPTDSTSDSTFHDESHDSSPNKSIANLFFTTNVDEAIKKADVIFVCVDTPSAPEDGVLGQSLCTKTLRKAIEKVGQVAVKNFILVEKCTVPCGTAKEVESILHKSLRSGVNFEVLSNPEFLAEGTAVDDLLHPDRVLIGSSPTETGMNAAQTLAHLYERWVPKEKILTIDTWSAELSKLAANAMLAQRISSINSLSAICESIDADIRTVSTACSLDERIGPHMLKPSVGFGGSCFQKDISYLVYLAASLGLDQVARYWQAVLDMNDYQQSRFVSRVKKSLSQFQSADTKIAVLGFAFKAKTNDSRNSAAIRIVKELIEGGFELAIYDPCVSEEEIWNTISGGNRNCSGRVKVSGSAHEALFRAHAAVILTEWDQFRYPPKVVIPDNAGPPTPESLDSPQLLGSDDAESMPMESTSAENVADEDRPDAMEVEDPNSDKFDPLDRVDLKLDDLKKKDPSLSKQRSQGNVQWQHVADVMLEPKQLFDGRNIIADEIVDLGFRIERIGKMSSPVP